MSLFQQATASASAVTCRAGTDDDLETVARIWIDGWRSNGITLANEPDYLQLRERISHEVANGWEIIVAERNGVVVGFVAIDRGAAQLAQIFVAPESHRAGVGKALLARAWKAMPDGFSLWTHADNHRAARFYEAMRMEFVGVGTHPMAGHGIRTYRYGRLPD